MRIAFLYAGDFMGVVGSTEPYYVLKNLSRNHEVCVFSRFQCSNALQPGVARFVYIKGGRLPYLLRYNILATVAVLLHGKFDVAYAYKDVFLPSLVLKSIFKTKLVYDFQALPVGQALDLKIQKPSFHRLFFVYLMRLFYKLWLKIVDLIVVVTDELGAILKHSYGCTSKKILIQPLGADLGLFKPRKASNLLGNVFTIMYVGSITTMRCPFYLFKAVEILKKKIPGVRLVLAGRGPEEQISRLKRTTRELRLEQLIEWAGEIPHNDIPNLLEKADVTISLLPRVLSYQVSSPAKIFEYLAMGKVVVATNISAHRRIIKNEQNGLLVKPGDSKALADAIERIYTDKELRKRIERASRDSVMKYDWNHMLNQLNISLSKLKI